MPLTPTATNTDEIDEVEKLIQCSECYSNGPFYIEHDFKLGLYIITDVSGHVIFKFEAV